MRPVHVICVGDFGQATAERLAALLPVVITRPRSDGQVVPADWPLASVHLLAAWRPVPRLAAVLDNVAYQWKVPWLPVICEHPYVRVGPAVIPGAGSCYTCFCRRVLQHSSRPDLLHSLHNHYDAHPDAGPRGFLHAFASSAAHTARGMLDRMLRQPAAVAGCVHQMDMIAFRALSGRAVGFHGCPRCGLKRDEATRSYLSLLEDLQSLVISRPEEMAAHE